MKTITARIVISIPKIKLTNSARQWLIAQIVLTASPAITAISASPASSAITAITAKITSPIQRGIATNGRGYEYRIRQGF